MRISAQRVASCHKRAECVIPTINRVNSTHCLLNLRLIMKLEKLLIHTINVIKCNKVFLSFLVLFFVGILCLRLRDAVMFMFLMCSFYATVFFITIFKQNIRIFSLTKVSFLIKLIMGRLTASQRHEAIGMLRYASVSQIASFFCLF